MSQRSQQRRIAPRGLINQQSDEVCIMQQIRQMETKAGAHMMLQRCTVKPVGPYLHNLVETAWQCQPQRTRERKSANFGWARSKWIPSRILWQNDKQTFTCVLIRQEKTRLSTFSIRLSCPQTFKPLNTWVTANRLKANTLKLNILFRTSLCQWAALSTETWLNSFPLLFPIVPGPEEAAMGGADWKGPGQTPWLLLRPAGRACHRGPGHTDGSSMRFPDAPGQLHQPSGGAHRYGPHLGQDAQLQGGWVRDMEQCLCWLCLAFTSF